MKKHRKDQAPEVRRHQDNSDWRARFDESRGKNRSIYHDRASADPTATKSSEASKGSHIPVRVGD